MYSNDEGKPVRCEEPTSSGFKMGKTMGAYIHAIQTQLDEKLGQPNTRIAKVFDALHDLLQYKNKKYGNSATDPIKIFSKVDATTGLLQRIDDKIARIKNSTEIRKNDTADLIGYLVLLCVTKDWDNFDEFKD